MAIGGGAVPVLEIWLIDGVIHTGYCTHANGDVVEDNLMSVIRRIRAGERVHMLRQGCNFSIVQFVIENGLTQQGG